MPMPALLTDWNPEDGSAAVGPLILAYVLPGYNWLAVTGSSDGITWSDVGLVTNTSSTVLQSSKAPPAICVYDSTYFMVYVANDDSNLLYVTTSTDGRAWTDARHVMGSPGSSKQSSKAAPALAANWNGLVLTYLANDESNDLCVTRSIDGMYWEEAITITRGQKSITAPALMNSSLITTV